MKKNTKQITKVIAFLMIGLLLVGVVQEVLTPEWNNMDNIHYSINGLFELEDDTIDVLFLGTSHMAFGISPMKIYEDTGICSYNLASVEQRLPTSYYLLKKTFQSQNPSVVVLDASSLFVDVTQNDVNSQWRYVLDNLKLDALKVEMAKEYGTYSYSDGKYSALFPIIKFHSRWNELSEQDFETNIPQLYYSAGQFICSRILGTSLTQESVDSVACSIMNNGKAKNLQISDNTQIWLSRINELCKENHASLLLTKIPTRIYPQDYTGAWTRLKYQETKKIAKSLGIYFWDLQYDGLLELDFTRDTRDYGQHLNFCGAEKVSAAVGVYFQEEFGLTGKSNPQYDRMLIDYNQMTEIIRLQTEDDMIEYLKKLAEHKNDWTIIIAASDEYTRYMDEDCAQTLKSFGLKKIDKGKLYDAYAAVIDNGSVIYESVSDKVIRRQIQVESFELTVESAGWYNSAGRSVCIDGKEYGMPNRGLNFVVYDNEYNMVIDSVTFDTHMESKASSHSWDAVTDILREYEKHLITNYAVTGIK